MRDASNSIRPGSEIQCCVLVGVTGEAARAASEHRFPPERIPRSAAATGLRRVCWFQEPDSNACQSREQLNTLCKLACCPPSPLWQTSGIFQTHTSTRTQCHGHRLSGFAGENLSLKSTRIASFGTTPFSLVSVRAVNNRLQTSTVIAVAAYHSTARADITAQPPLRLLDFSQGHRHRDASIPLAVFPEDLRRLVQCGSRQGQCSIDCPMFPGRDIEPAVATPRSRRAPQHDPAIKALGLARLLDLRRVDEFGLEKSRRVTRFGGALVVDVGPAIGTPDKLPEPLRAGKARLLCTCKLICDIRMQALKQSSQRRKRVRFTTGGKELELVPKRYGCHALILANCEEKETPPQDAQIREQPFMALERPLRLQAYGLQRLPTSSRSAADRHVRLALLGASVRACAPRRYTPSRGIEQK